MSYSKLSQEITWLLTRVCPNGLCQRKIVHLACEIFQISDNNDFPKACQVEALKLLQWRLNEWMKGERATGSDTVTCGPSPVCQHGVFTGNWWWVELGGSSDLWGHMWPIGVSQHDTQSLTCCGCSQGLLTACSVDQPVTNQILHRL